MEALREARPDITFEGVAGPRMLDVGIDAWAPMDMLSVMGLFEVLRHLPRLLRLRAQLVERWRDTPPDVFIGVDAPDFNLGLERRLRDAGVPTVHYVSPTVWAWRTGRVRDIRRAVDLLLTIFPFEREFLQSHGVASHYVGHPLAADMPLQPDREHAREVLDLDPGKPVLAVLPGSRCGEVHRLSRPFLETAVALQRERLDLQVVVPLVNEATRAAFDGYRKAFAAEHDILVRVGATHEALAAADVVLTASGTATLEGLLSKRPMVVGYKVNDLTYHVARLLRLVKVDHVAMANLLADERLAPEFIQQDCEPAQLVPALQAFLDDRERREEIARRYQEIHAGLRQDTNQEAAKAVLKLLHGYV